MASWLCRDCTAEYSVDAPGCPQCGATDPIREDEQLRRELEEMAKITVHGGATNADAEEPAAETPVETPTESVETTVDAVAETAATDEAEKAAAEADAEPAEQPKRGPARRPGKS